MEKKWWHDKVAYQIYPKSFLDTNGDGIGDLRGIISKLDYLKKLGIDIIWLSPIYKSPFVDQGYDIADYYAIAEEFGTMEEFDELLAEAKKRDMHIIMDLVINHCSDKHEWFQKALADPDGAFADYFYFRKGKNGNPPSNYRSYFGGSCWEKIPGTDKYYFHMFAKEQPDLNWENPKLPLPGREGSKVCFCHAFRRQQRMVVGDFAAIVDLLHMDGNRLLHGKRPARVRHQPRKGCRHILRQKATIRSGIGDEPLFVKTLGIIQGLLCRKTQQAVGIPLQCCQVIELRRAFGFLLAFHLLYRDTLLLSAFG